MSAGQPRRLGIGQWLPGVPGAGWLPRSLAGKAEEVGWETAVPSTAGHCGRRAPWNCCRMFCLKGEGAWGPLGGGVSNWHLASEPEPQGWFW